MGNNSTIPPSPPPHRATPVPPSGAAGASQASRVAQSVIRQQPPSAAASFAGVGVLVQTVVDAFKRAPPPQTLGAPPLMRALLNSASTKWGGDTTQFKIETVHVVGDTLNFQAMLPTEKKAAPFTLAELPEEEARLPALQDLVQEGMTIAMRVGDSVYVTGSVFITVETSGKAHFQLYSQKIPLGGANKYLILAPPSVVEALQSADLSTIASMTPRNAALALSQLSDEESGAICVIDLSKSP